MIHPILPTALLTLALPAGAAAQSLDLYPQTELFDIAASSGVIAAGSYQYEAATFSPGGIVTPLPGALEIVQTSKLGTVHLGKIVKNGALRATRWTTATGWVELPQAPFAAGDYSNPTAMSADGKVVCGMVIEALQSPHTDIAYRWSTSGGIVALGNPAVTGETRAYDIASDGSVIGGYAWTPGVTYAHAVVWDAAGVMTDLLPSWFVDDGSTMISSVRVVNSDGSRFAGRRHLDAFIWDSVGEPVVIPRPDALLGTGANLFPTAMADDGSVVIGYSYEPVSVHAWIWTPGQGTRLLDDITAQLMLDAGGLPLKFPTDTSADGLTLCGTRSDAVTGVPEGWLLELPAAGVGKITDLGHALPGSTEPVLSAFGSLGPLTPARVVVDELIPLSTVTIVVGLSRIDAPIKGGVLVPSPDVLFTVPSLGGGPNPIDFTWPAGVPSGASIWVQAWQQSAGGPLGFAASKALQLTTP